MSDLISEGESQVKEATPDVSGMFKFVGWLVMGVLTIAGISWLDILNGKQKATKKENKETDEETQADYEEEYLDETISEDELDKKETGLSG